MLTFNNNSNCYWGVLLTMRSFKCIFVFVIIQSLSRVRIFVTPWTEACQASLSFTISQARSLSWWCYHIISSSAARFSFCLQSFPASGSFPMSQVFASTGQNTGNSASELVLPMNIQDWFPLGLTGLISMQSKGLSRVFSSTTIQKHQFFGAQLLYGPTLTSRHDYWKNHSFGYTGLCRQSDVSAFKYAV